MKFRIKVGDLLNAVDDVSYTVDKKGAEGFAGVLVLAKKTETTQSLYLYSTIHKAETVTKIDADVEESGQGLFNIAQLRAGLMYRNAEDEAVITRVISKGEGDRIQVKIGKTNFSVVTNPTGLDEMIKRMNEIPFRQAESYTMKGSDLAEFVRRAAFCIPTDNDGTGNFELGGMKLLIGSEGYEVHATDGHVCSRILIKGEAGPNKMQGVLIPNLALPALAKLVKKEQEIKIIEGQKNGQGVTAKLFFKIGANTFFGTRLLSGQFPNIESVFRMHQPEFWFGVDKVALRQALDRNKSFDDNQYAHLRIKGDVLQIIGKGQKGDNFDEVAVVREEGMPDDLDVPFVINLPYLRSIAAGSTRDSIRLGISDYTQKVKKARAVIADDAEGNVSAAYAILQVKQ